MVINFFSKCGITLILFPLIMASFCMIGCLEKAAQLPQTSSMVPQDQEANPCVQMDFDAELRSDLFGMRGNIMLPGNSSLAYLMLNASLHRGETVQFSTKYLLMQIEPNRDCSFEIARNVKIPAGEYNCTLEAKGPSGVLAEESRRISLAESQLPAFEQVPWPMELDEEVSGQKNEEVRPKEESSPPKKKSNSPKEEQAVLEEIGDKKSLETSSTLPKEAKAEFVGSVTSKKYHRVDCRYALKIKPENCIYFQSIEEAEEQGYLPCKICSP